MVSNRWFEFGPESRFRHHILTSILPQFHLCFTSILPLFNHFFYLSLTSAQPAISNHGLETTVYNLGLDSIENIAEILDMTLCRLALDAWPSHVHEALLWDVFVTLSSCLKPSGKALALYGGARGEQAFLGVA